MNALPNYIVEVADQVTVLRSARVHWRSIAILSLIALMAASAYGYTRPNVYSAEARVLVGSYDTRVAAIPGAVAASQTMASTYSRVVGTSLFADRVADLSGLPKAHVAGHMSASAVVGAPIVSIIGTGADSGTAVKISNGAAQALSDYTRSLNPNTPEAVLKKYTDVNGQLMSAQGALDDMQQRLKARPSDTDLADTAADKQSEVLALQLQARALESSYQNVADSGSFGVQQLQMAVSTGSSRFSTIQFYGFIGLFLGVVVSTSLAVLRERRRLRAHQEETILLTEAQHLSPSTVE